MQRKVASAYPAYLVPFLVVCITLLLLVDAAITYWHYEVSALHGLLRDQFNVDHERNLPTWFSSVQLLTAAHVANRIRRDLPTERSLTAASWFCLSAGLLFMSMDEVCGFHETLNSFTRGEWTLYGAGVAGFAAVLLVPVLLSVNVTTALMFVVAGGMFVAGAVGVEHQSAWFAEFNLLDTLEYRKQTLLEEGLEMISVTLFIYAAVRHLRQTQVVTG